MCGFKPVPNSRKVWFMYHKSKKGEHRTTETTAPLWVDLLGHCRQQTDRHENKLTGEKHEIPSTLRTIQFLQGRTRKEVNQAEVTAQQRWKGYCNSPKWLEYWAFSTDLQKHRARTSTWLEGWRPNFLLLSLSLTKCKARRKGGAQEGWQSSASSADLSSLFLF